MTVSITIVTPVYKGEEFLEGLVSAIDSVKLEFERMGTPFQIKEAIFVDDSSVDSSSEVLIGISKAYDWVKVVTLSRNFGQHAATVAGVCHSYGDWIVTLDEDLQHDPNSIIELVKEQARSGADVVYAKPRIGSHGGWRDWASTSVKRVVASLTSVPQIKLFNSFRLIRGSVARAAASSSSSQTYFDMALTWYTSKVSSIEFDIVDSRYAEEGSSGYRLSSLLAHGRRLLRSSDLDFSLIGFVVGLSSLGISLVASIVAIFLRLFAPNEIALVGWTSLFTTIMLIGSISILLLCIILEYVSLLSSNVLGKPTFFTIDRSDDPLVRKWFEEHKI